MSAIIFFSVYPWLALMSYYLIFCWYFYSYGLSVSKLWLFLSGLFWFTASWYSITDALQSHPENKGKAGRKVICSTKSAASSSQLRRKPQQSASLQCRRIHQDRNVASDSTIQSAKPAASSSLWNKNTKQSSNITAESLQTLPAETGKPQQSD